MKHDELRSIAHNVAASLASGISFLVGSYELDVFASAKQSTTGDLVVDFLRGTIDPAPVPAELAEAIAAFPAVLPALCQRHGTTVSAFNVMSARYWATLQGGRFTVTVVDQSGRKTETDYGGYDGQRTKMLDTQGRMRVKPIRCSIGG